MWSIFLCIKCLVLLMCEQNVIQHIKADLPQRSVASEVFMLAAEVFFQDLASALNVQH